MQEHLRLRQWYWGFASVNGGLATTVELVYAVEECRARREHRPQFIHACLVRTTRVPRKVPAGAFEQNGMGRVPAFRQADDERPPSVGEGNGSHSQSDYSRLEACPKQIFKTLHFSINV
jgi:hypothetical protein